MKKNLKMVTLASILTVGMGFAALTVTVPVEVNAAVSNTMIAQAVTQNHIEIIFNGRTLVQNDDIGFAVNVDGRTFVPLRLITEAMGFDVQFGVDGPGVITMSQQGQRVFHRVGTLTATDATTGGNVLGTTDVPSYIDSSTERTMVSLRLISEAFGADVQWQSNATGGRVTVTTDAQAVTQGERITSLEEFYDIVERHADGTVTVRTNTGELVRLALSNEALRGLAQYRGTPLVNGINIGFSSFIYRDPDTGIVGFSRNPERRRGELVSGTPGIGANTVGNPWISGLGGIVHVEQVDDQGNLIIDLGHFMADDILGLMNMPEGARYRLTLLKAPYDFTLNQYNQNATPVNANGNPYIYTNRGVEFMLMPE